MRTLYRWKMKKLRREFLLRSTSAAGAPALRRLRYNDSTMQRDWEMPMDKLCAPSVEVNGTTAARLMFDICSHAGRIVLWYKLQ